MMMRPQKISPRADYRRQESLRVQESVSLSEKFRELKSLTVAIAYFSAEGVAQNGALKCTFAPDHAKSVVRFDCHKACRYTPLLGAIPMEGLDVVVFLRKRKLVVNPKSPDMPRSKLKRKHARHI